MILSKTRITRVQSDCADAQAGLRCAVRNPPKTGFLELRPIYRLILILLYHYVWENPFVR